MFSITLPNVMYVAAYLKYWEDRWESKYTRISYDPAILGTLYNLGTRAKSPNANPKPNKFGKYVKDNYLHMGKLLGL